MVLIDYVLAFYIKHLSKNRALYETVTYKKQLTIQVFSFATFISICMPGN